MLCELQDYMSCYINGFWNLRELESRLLANLQRILDSGEKLAIDIANRVDAELIALNEGLIDEKTLIESLRNILISTNTVELSAYDTQPLEVIRAEAVASTVGPYVEHSGPQANTHSEGFKAVADLLLEEITA